MIIIFRFVHKKDVVRAKYSMLMLTEDPSETEIYVTQVE